jgi:transglutaminase-like putative cysteine protease
LAPENRAGRLVGGVTLVMMALATASIELAIAEPGRSKLASMAWAAALMIPVLMVAWQRARAVRRGRETPREAGGTSLAVVALLVVFVLPFAIDAGRVAWFGRGRMLEILLLASVRNLGLGLAALSDRVVFARLAALLSLFLVAVSSAMAEGAATIAVVGLYAAAGCLWLMMNYWGALRLEASTAGRARFPVATLGLILLLVGSVLAVAAVGPTRAATVLAGLMPTSGGTWWDDPEARGGVNDGDNEVAASEKPESVGFTESEVYLETDRPSLYDAFSESYGEAFKPKKLERMVALGQQDIQEQRERPAENLQAGRQFPLSRRPPSQPSRRPGDRRARAVLYVKGPTPLHLPLLAYDGFDGRAWSEERPSIRKLLLEPDDGAWFRVEMPRPPIFTGTVAHQVKVGTLESSPLPIPSHIRRFRVGSVNREDFFGWSQDGIAKMAGRTVPAGTLIETEALTVDPGRLAESPPRETSRAVTDRYSTFETGYSVNPAVAALGASWTEGRPRGWAQVDAVVDALRRGYVLDRSATTPADCTDAAGHFLLEARRGPDYQFATAAAVVLRSLGYPVRVVSGFYASPEKYDPRTHHTHVDRDDVHFWAEIQLTSGTWVAIEPTPGYRLMGPVIPWGEQLARFFVAAWRRLRDHPLPVGAVALICLALYRLRRDILDGLRTLAWRLTSRRADRRRVVQTLRLVERRARLAGRPRPSGQTPGRWCRAVASSEPAEVRIDLERLVRLADWAVHAPDRPGARPPWADPEIHATCRRSVQVWTLRRFRAVVRPA